VTNMTIPQTRQATVSAAPCPPWCHEHFGDLHEHRSGVQVWDNPAANEGDDWRVEVSLYRGDDNSPWMPTAEIGDTVVELYITGESGMINVAADENRPQLSGYLLPDQIRSLAKWLLAKADEADPHHTNGQPSLLGLER
jgi:hypothetical protein